MTIKYGKSYEDTWAGFKGDASDVRLQIEQYFGMEHNLDLNLNEVVINATQIAHGMVTAVSGLGGKVVSAGPTTAPKTDEAQSGSTDVWAAAEQESPAEEPVHPIFAQIEAETTVAGLKRLWAENQPAFRNADVMNAWKARGKALSA